MKHRAIYISIFVVIVLQFVDCSRDPQEWKIVRLARADEPVTFHVALHQRNTDLLEKHLYEISDPTHPRYGEEMTHEEIMSLIAPPKEDHDAVVNWFKAYGNFVKIHSFGDALKITAPSHLVEKMLNTRLYKYQHIEKTHIHAIRQVGGFTIPSEISDKIYMVTGLTSFPFIRKDITIKEKMLDAQYDALAVAKRQASINYQFVAIANVRKVYNVLVGTTAQVPTTNQMVMQILPEAAPYDKDIVNFIQVSNEVYTNYSKIFGPFTNNGDIRESTLDVEMMMGLGSKVSNWYYTVANGWIYEMALELFNLKETPQVVSLSYSWPEIDSCDSAVTHSHCDGMSVSQWVNRTNIELMKVGLRRVSMLSSSGDSGAAGNLNNYCTNTDHPVFAHYPASSPYITSISATTLTPASSSDEHMKRGVAQHNSSVPFCSQDAFPCISGPVTEWPAMLNNTFYQWTTGGGFSELSSMPSYQTSAVEQYLSTPNLFIPPSKYFNAANRGYPDFSVVGSRILTVVNEIGLVSEGTSASTPLAASMIALLNDARAQINKKSLGFLNPMLYKMYSDNPATFNDVTMGDNHCTKQNCCTCGYGATKGWDAVTGLGTPNFVAMRKYVTANLP